MALDYTISPLPPTTFGSVPGNQTSDLTLTITVGAGVGSVVFSSFSGLSAPFSLPNNETSVEVVAGGTYDLVIRFSPTSIAAFTDTLHIDAAGATDLGTDIVCSGIGGLAQHSLPVINHNPCGIIKAYLLHDPSITDLTYPTTVPFMLIGKQRESIDAEVGTTEFDNIDIDIAEDYSTHTEGFWHKLINGYPALDFELMFTIMEGTDETFSFRGKIHRINVQETEHYLNSLTGTPTVVVRGVSFKLVSSLKVLEEVSVLELGTELASHVVAAVFPPNIGADNCNAISFAAIFASMIKLGYGEAYDTSLIINNSTDIQIYGYYNTAGYKSFLEFYINCDFFFPSPLTSGSLVTGHSYRISTYNTNDDFTNVGATSNTQDVVFEATGTTPTHWDHASTLLDITTGNYLARFSNCFELLKHICGQFGVIPRYTFGTSTGLIDATPSNNKHRITLNSRGGRSGSVTMTGKLTNSVFLSGTSRKSKRIRVAQHFFPVIIAGVSVDNMSKWYSNNVESTGIAPPSIVFDIDKQVDFYTNSYPSVIQYIGIYENRNDGYFGITQKVRFWNYSLATPAYEVIDKVANAYLCDALAKYLFNRMGEGRVEYEREYGSIKANDGSINSQRACQTLMRHIIHDGVTSRTFYATEVEKDIFNNRVRVIWVQE